MYFHLNSCCILQHTDLNNKDSDPAATTTSPKVRAALRPAAERKGPRRRREDGNGRETLHYQTHERQKGREQLEIGGGGRGSQGGNGTWVCTATGRTIIMKNTCDSSLDAFIIHYTVGLIFTVFKDGTRDQNIGTTWRKKNINCA